MRRRLKNWYEAYIGKVIPRYAFFSVIFCFVFNSLIYTGTQIIMKDAKHYDLSREGNEDWFKFATGDYLSRVVCMVFFILLPTTNTRPEVTGDGIVENIMRFIYFADPATNLFPSIHCLVSWLCYAGIRGRKIIPLWYRAFSCIFAIMVFISTQFTKQHYIADVIGGGLIAEICLYIGNHTKLYKTTSKIFGKINQKVFGDIIYDREEEQEYF